MSAWGRVPLELRVVAIASLALLAGWIATMLASPDLVVAGAVAVVLLAAFLVNPVDALLAFALVSLFSETASFVISPAFGRVDELSVPGIVVLGAVRLRPWRGGRPDRLREGGILLVVVAGVASSLVRAVPPATWLPALALLMKGIGFFYVATWVRPSRDDLARAARLVLIIGGVVGALGIIEAFNPAAFQQALGLPPYLRPRGSLPSVKSLFDHPGLFAWFTTFCAIYAYLHFVQFRKWWMLGLAALLSVGTILSARRSAILAGVLAVAGLFGWDLRRRGVNVEAVRRWVPVSVVGVLLLGIFFSGFLSLVNRTIVTYLPSPGATPSMVASPSPGSSPQPGGPDDEGPQATQARVVLYRTALEIGEDRFPLGAGLGRYGSAMSRINYSPVYAEYGIDKTHGLTERHSQFLTDTFWPMLLGETGVIGLAGFLLFLAAIAVRLWRRAAAEQDAFVQVFVMGSLAVLLAAMVESLSAPIFTSPPRTYLLMLAIGVAGSLNLASSPAPAADGEDLAA